MSEENAFTRILNRLQTEEEPVAQEKTAAVLPTSPAPSDALMQSIDALSQESKTASVADTPATQLEHMAKQAHEAEAELLQKQAQHMGAAIADGFMERFAQYDTALSSAGIKTASTPDTADLEKAAEYGYNKAVIDMEKTAEAEYDRGYVEQMQEVHKLAADTHYTGQVVARQIISSISK